MAAGDKARERCRQAATNVGGKLRRYHRMEMR